MSDNESNGHADARRVSVIIPTLNEAAYLPDLLDALAAQTLLPAEVIVADAGSTDGTAELARAHGARQRDPVTTEGAENTEKKRDPYILCAF